jgi:hypothetical protein
LHENLQGIPGAAAETGKKLSIIQKVPAQDFGEAEDKMPVGNLLENIHTEPLSEFHHAFLMAGRAEMPSFTRKSQQVFMAAVFAFHAGKAVSQIAAIEITVNHLLDIRPPEAVLPGEVFVVGLNEGFKIVLDTVVIIRILRSAGMI